MFVKIIDDMTTLKSLVLTLAIVLLVLPGCTQSTKAGGTTEVVNANPKEFYDLLAQEKDPQLLDIRTSWEYNRGFIEGSLNIDYSGSAFKEDLEKLEKNRPVFIYCAVGGRSAQAVSLFKSLGFTKVVDLKGGIVSWQRSGLPLVK